jgi:RimJ/RimL family protein N-acetyltransferase
MEVKIAKAGLKDIEPMRKVFLEEGNFQFVYNKCHENNWADQYIFTSAETLIGYGCVWGRNKREVRDAIFEFFVVKSYRKLAGEIFSNFAKKSGATFIECQTNDTLLAQMLYEQANNIEAEAILFKDNHETYFERPELSIGRTNQSWNCVEYILKRNEDVVGEGGMMLNYNFPYADLYYNIKEEYRRQGFATFFIQQLKREAYLMGRVPAARCNVNNRMSKASLLKAGFVICGYILAGKIKAAA